MLYLDVMATDTASLTPVEIDTELSRIWTDRAKAEASLEAARRSANRSEHNARTLAGKISDLESRVACLDYEASPYNAEYNRRPWNRYFLVQNSNGHVHRGTNCTTCNWNTSYGWLVDLADCDEAAMIEEWGERACTVCFPSAPTNPLYNRPARIDREAREAKAAEQAAKDAAKAEKAITDVDGSPLKDSHGYTLKTKVAARNELSQAFQNLTWYGSQEYVDTIHRLVPALDAAGVDWQKSATNAVAKVAKEVSKPNPWAHQLTPEQVADTAAKNKANLALAQALLKEVVG